ncbi:Ser/Thr protein phosphatase superfamily [Apiospora rasikravindrae]|uniref:Ser/Thr protein phosphatase superfamily n=1 Tax=Apiospora rasikravindrae TaxID=990691 RepID=A0ABR1S0D9_9PEZI
MVKIQIQSDLHLEAPKTYDIFEIIPKAPYLALLGDIGCLAKHYDEYTQFLLIQLRNFKAVLLVLGNHEPYHSSWQDVKASMAKFQEEVAARKQAGEQLGTFVLLDQTRFDIDDEEADGDGGVTILGCTLFSSVPQKSRKDVGLRLNDFNYIEDWGLDEHNQACASDIAWLNSEVQSAAPKRRIAVLTHYCPTLDARAQDPRHANSPIQSGFATDLSGEACWKSEAVKLWAFGHTHYNCDFVDDEHGKRIYTNQRGYSFSQSPGFDGTVVVEV